MIARDAARTGVRSCTPTTMVAEPFFSSWAQNPTSLFIPDLLSALASAPAKKGYVWCRTAGKPFYAHSCFHTRGDRRFITRSKMDFALVLRQVPPHGVHALMYPTSEFSFQSQCSAREGLGGRGGALPSGLALSPWVSPFCWALALKNFILELQRPGQADYCLLCPLMVRRSWISLD